MRNYILTFLLFFGLVFQANAETIRKGATIKGLQTYEDGFLSEDSVTIGTVSEDLSHIVQSAKATSGNVLQVIGNGTAGAYLGITELAVETFYIGMDNGSSVLKFRPTTTATAAIAEATTTGTWTLGINNQTGFGLHVEGRSFFESNQVGAITTPNLILKGSTGDFWPLSFRASSTAFFGFLALGSPSPNRLELYHTGDTGSTTTKLYQVQAGGDWSFGDFSSTTLSHNFNSNATGVPVLDIISVGTAGTYIRLTESGTKAYLIGLDDSSSILKFRQDSITGTTYGELGSTGAWTFGSTGTTPGHTMQGADNSFVLFVDSYRLGADANGIQVKFRSAAPNNTTAMFLNCEDNAVTRIQLRSNGGIANYQSNDVNLSDERLKTNIVDAPSQLDFILNLKVKQFSYKDALEKTTIGLIAQDVEKLDASLIEDGFRVENGEDSYTAKAIRTSDIMHRSIKAIQELKVQVNCLRDADTKEARLACF